MTRDKEWFYLKHEASLFQVALFLNYVILKLCAWEKMDLCCKNECRNFRDVGKTYVRLKVWLVCETSRLL